MKRKFWMWGAALATMFMLAGCLAIPAAAQSTGRIVGEVRDNSGKVWPGCKIEAKSEEMGGTTVVETDKDGRYAMVGLRPGIYTIFLKAVVVNPNAPKPDPKAPPKAPEYTPITDSRARVTSGGEEVVNFNIKEMIDKAGTAATEARKKQEEEAKKFEGLKAHFDAGHTALELAKPMRGEIDRAPADQKPAMLEKQTGILQEAVTHFQAAIAAAGEKDPNLPVLWVNLGEALDYSKKYDESADAYQKAIVLKPTEAGYFNNLGNVLAKAGKLPEASAAYQKSAELDPSNAATAWRNFGIVLYNNNKMKEMVDPLQKSTTLDPKVADTWYLLGVGLMASMESKQVGDKITFDIKPGTVEAYQKYLELAPTGKFANDAKGALTALESMGAQGVSTKMKVTKKKG